MLYVLLELKGIEEQYFIELAPKIEEVGRMLYGWKNQALKENHPAGSAQHSPQNGNKKE